MANVVAICLGFCGVVLFTHLLRSGAISGATYATLTLGVLLSSIAVSRIELLELLDLKNLQVKVREIQQIKSELFAKTEAVQRLGEHLGELAAWNIRTVNRFTDDGSGHQKQMLSQRDRISAMLREIGATPDRIRQIVEPIESTVESDLKQHLRDFFQRRIHTKGLQKEPFDQDAARQTLEQHIKAYNRVALTDRSRDLGLYDPTLESILDELDRFITSRSL